MVNTQKIVIILQGHVFLCFENWYIAQHDVLDKSNKCFTIPFAKNQSSISVPFSKQKRVIKMHL